MQQPGEQPGPGPRHPVPAGQGAGQGQRDAGAQPAQQESRGERGRHGEELVRAAGRAGRPHRRAGPAHALAQQQHPGQRPAGRQDEPGRGGGSWRNR